MAANTAIAALTIASLLKSTEDQRKAQSDADETKKQAKIEQQRQKDELAAIKKSKEAQDVMAANIAKKKSQTPSSAGGSGTLLGVLNPEANNSQGRVKTLLGE